MMRPKPPGWPEGLNTLSSLRAAMQLMPHFSDPRLLVLNNNVSLMSVLRLESYTENSSAKSGRSHPVTLILSLIKKCFQCPFHS